MHPFMLQMARRASIVLGLLLAPAVFAASVPVQTFETSAGPVRIMPIYHAAAMIEAGGDRIYIDPARPANISGLAPGDLILITHDHPDHMDAGYIAALSKAATQVIAPAAVRKSVTQARVLANGESMTWRGWKITAVPAYNMHHLTPAGEPYHPKGRGNGYVLTYGGKNFYFAGDTEGTPEMRALRNIDVAFIPMNLPYTMTPDEAADAVKAFRPRVVIPYHYRGQNIQRFADDLKGTGIDVRLLDWYSNKAEGAE